MPVQPLVLGRSHGGKILGPVVGAVAVQMMHLLVRAQFAAKLSGEHSTRVGRE